MLSICLKSKGNIFLIPSQIGLLEFVSNHFMIIIVFEQDNFKIKRFLNLVLLIEIDNVTIDLKNFQSWKHLDIL